MQKINLLPGDLAPPVLSDELVLLIRKTGIHLGILVSILVLLGIGLRVEFARRNNILIKIMTKVEESDLLAENIEDLRKRGGTLRQELASIDVYLSRGLLWSEKLKQISLLMPKEVWLTGIIFKRIGAGRRGPRKEVLNIKGALVPLENTPSINVLSAFVNTLKEDKDFFGDFEDLLISEVKRGKKRKLDIMEFELKFVLKR